MYSCDTLSMYYMGLLAPVVKKTLAAFAGLLLDCCMLLGPER